MTTASDVKKEETTVAQDAAAMSSESALQPVEPKAPMVARGVQSIQAGREKGLDGRPIRREFISAGERIHNEITYRGVDLILNAILGVTFTVVTHRTELGRKYFTHPVEGFFTKLFTPMAKTAKGLKSSVQWGVNFLSIMFGGSAIIPVVMALEKKENKHRIVSALDRTIYGKDTVENDPKFVQSYEEMDRLPKKDFWTGMAARGVALAPLIAITLHGPSHAKLEKHFYEPIAKGMKWTAQKLGVKERGFLGRMSTHGLAEGDKAASNFNYILKIASFDVGLTAIYSFLHEFSYKFFARKEDDHRIKKAERRAEAGDSSQRDEDDVSDAALDGALTQMAERPEAKVSAVSRENTLTAPPELAPSV